MAVTVTDDAQGRGLGRRLVEVLAVAARERGIETFEASVLGSNWRTREFLRRIDAQYCRNGDVQEYIVATAAIVAPSAGARLSRCPGIFVH